MSTGLAKLLQRTSSKKKKQEGEERKTKVQSLTKSSSSDRKSTSKNKSNKRSSKRSSKRNGARDTSPTTRMNETDKSSNMNVDKDLVSRAFVEKKNLLKTQVLLESFHSLDYKVEWVAHDDLGDSTSVSDKDTLEQTAEKAWYKLLHQDEDVDPSLLFLRQRDRIEKSKIFQILSGMPKGALLHTHGISTGPFEALVKCLRADPRIYVYMGSSDNAGLVYGESRYLTKSEIEEKTKDGEWIKGSDLSEEEYLNLLEIPSDLKLESSDDIWPVFQNIWLRIRELSDALPIWRGKDSFFWHMLKKLLDTGVTYVEIKQLIPEGWVDPSEDGETIDRQVPIQRFMETFADTVNLFKKEYPRFIGAKMIWCTLKLLEPKVVEENSKLVLDLMKEFPDLIAGYDLVGHEDGLNPIAKYAKSLIEFRQRGGRLLLHAGETLEPTADQIYDAVTLGSERIGHAYALPKFPALMRLVKQRGITVECCPLSNQALGYVRDLRNHPGLIMMNNGVQITISSDDAAIFGYADLTFDIVMVARAWGLTLSQLRHLCKASFKCTGLSYEDQVVAEKQFDHDWLVFLKDFVASDSALEALKN